jgi:CHRD domain-containing protein
MSNKMTRNGCRLTRGGILAALLTLLAILHSTTFAHKQNGQDLHTMVSLQHAPHGTADLTWNPQATTLTVTMKLSGLQAQTSHPAHIHSGDCSTDGDSVYPLNHVVADAAGNGISTTTINNVTGGIPATGWHITVHSGPTLQTPAEALAISCGNVVNQQRATNTTQSVSVPLDGANADNQQATGTADLSLDQATLTVHTTVSNLVPGSEHAAHIHAGSCESQLPGNILYPLTPLKADTQGVARSVTVIPNVSSLPASGWYINIHFGTDLSTQTGFDSIACGNVEN